MAIFKNDPDEWQRLDWQILQNGWTSLYWQQSILNEDLDWFKNEQYEIINLDCTTWTNDDQVHIDLKKGLSFPEYYGNNLNALNDCLHDLEIQKVGLVICLRHFQIVDNDLAYRLLDIFANHSRLQSLFGKRLITLVQVDNPNYEIKSIGSYEIEWNGAEWLNSKRSL